jgi:hypothetical protein
MASSRKKSRRRPTGARTEAPKKSRTGQGNWWDGIDFAAMGLASQCRLTPEKVSEVISVVSRLLTAQIWKLGRHLEYDIYSARWPDGSYQVPMMSVSVTFLHPAEYRIAVLNEMIQVLKAAGIARCMPDRDRSSHTLSISFDISEFGDIGAFTESPKPPNLTLVKGGK